jgi:hypothetical protein
MAPKKWTADDAKAAGFSIHNFFKVLSPPPLVPPPPPPLARTAGRPKKNEKRGRPVVEPLTPEPFAQSFFTPVPGVLLPATSAVGSSSKKAKTTRVNYSSGEPLALLQNAVTNWLEKKGEHYDRQPDMSLKHYCLWVGIPYETFKKYVCSDVGKRAVIGRGVGSSKLLDDSTVQFCVDMIRRKDRANDGMTKRAIIDMLQDLHPGLKRIALVKAFDRNIRRDNKDLLTGIIKAQASTEKRSAITVPQQYRWHSCIDAAFRFLRNKNVGLTPDGKTFGEVMPHFLLGGDETCFLASNGEVKIIGDKKKAKHEVTTAGSRTSITVYRSGAASGNDGPTAYLPAGVHRKAAFTDEFLVRQGSAPGSTVVMTPTGYMTEEAWVKMAPSMASGIRQMPVVSDMPEWWVLKIIDGFGAHTSSVAAMEIYEKEKILLLKEEGDTSHVCQAYDQEVAKADKRSMRTSLDFLRKNTRVTHAVIDSWDLVLVGLAAVRELAPASWITSFKKVNLHPHFRVDFRSWCDRISHFLQGGASFKG